MSVTVLGSALDRPNRSSILQTQVVDPQDFELLPDNALHQAPCAAIHLIRQAMEKQLRYSKNSKQNRRKTHQKKEKLHVVCE